MEIPKKDGSYRLLGIPTVSDRTAQQVVKSVLEPIMEQVFDEDSYGYRPGDEVYLFEPVQIYYQELLDAYSSNKLFHIYNIALSDKKGTADFYITWKKQIYIHCRMFF